MNILILRFYNITDEEMQKYNLYYKTRKVVFDYINKKIFTCAFVEDYATKNETLKRTKHKFTRKV